LITTLPNQTAGQVLVGLLGFLEGFVKAHLSQPPIVLPPASLDITQRVSARGAVVSYKRRSTPSPKPAPLDYREIIGGQHFLACQRYEQNEVIVCAPSILIEEQLAGGCFVQELSGGISRNRGCRTREQVYASACGQAETTANYLESINARLEISDAVSAVARTSEAEYICPVSALHVVFT